MIKDIWGRCSCRAFVFLSGLLVVLMPGQTATCQNDSFPRPAAQTADVPTFEVATVKPAPANEVGWKLQFTLDGFTARGVMLRQVIQEAYAVYEEDRMSPGPDWITSKKFDIEAKMGDDSLEAFKDLSVDQRRLMLQKLLAERFGLRIHRETKEIPVLALTVAKGGPKLHESQPGSAGDPEIKGIHGLILRRGKGYMEIREFSMQDFAEILSNQLLVLRRIVVDRTGLTSRYDIALKWDVEEARQPAPMIGADGKAQIPPPGTQEEASLAAALRQQLGLRLDAVKAPMECIVIDHVEMPSSN